MNTEPLVLLEIDNSTAKVILNRPNKMNALSDALISQLMEKIALADEDSNVRVIVLSAAGEHFGAGFDLKESSYAKSNMPLSHYTWMIRSMRNTYQAFLNTRKPVIAKIQSGYCIAGACYLQMLCDVSIAAEGAKLGHPAVASGGVSAMPLWNYYLGARKAKEMLLTGKIIDAKEAEKIGLINQAVPEERLDAEVDALARQIANIPTDANILCKEALNSCADIMGLSAMFRTHGHLSALARFGEVDLDIKELQAKNTEKARTLESSS